MLGKLTDEEVLEQAMRLFPCEDWSKVPDIETVPDIYVIRGKTKDKMLFGPVGHRREIEQINHFQIDEEYATLKKAQDVVEQIKLTWTNLVPNTIEIVTMKPAEAVEKYLYKERILKIKNDNIPRIS